MRRVYTVALLATLLVSGAQAAQPICGNYPAAAPALKHLREAMAQGRFVAYEPTSLQVVLRTVDTGRPGQHSRRSEGLTTRFDSLITYGSINGAEAIPAIAASLGFRAVIIGIWNPFDAVELNAAVTAARNNPSVVVGLSLGNEMLFFHRHSAAELTTLLDAVHARNPRLPLATTEPFQMLETPEAAPILQRLDFLLPIVHPIFQPWFRTAPNSKLRAIRGERRGGFIWKLLRPDTREGNWNSNGTGREGLHGEEKQASFYGELQRRLPASGDRAFSYFAAFDAPWRLNDLGPGAGAAPGAGGSTLGSVR